MSKWNEEHIKGCFWIQNKFIREQAKDLPIHAQMVYITLCCHANDNKETFVGCRRIASCLGINKDTVSRHIRKLETAGLVEMKKRRNGRSTVYKISTESDIEEESESEGSLGYRKNFVEKKKPIKYTWIEGEKREKERKEKSKKERNKGAREHGWFGVNDLNKSV